jgi:uncharacterized membrane protein
MDPKRTILSAVGAVLLSAATIVGASAQPATSSLDGDWIDNCGGVACYGYTSHLNYAARAARYRRHHPLMNAAPATSGLDGDWIKNCGGVACY